MAEKKKVKKNEEEVGAMTEKIIGNLTPKQEKFCRNYSLNNEFFGNATLSYADAYGFDLDSASKDDAIYSDPDDNGHRGIIKKSSYHQMYDQCSALASRLARNEKIQNRNHELMNEMLRDIVVDSRMMRIIMRGKDADSITAIKEYNKIRGRVIEKNQILDGDGKPFIPSVIRIVEAKPESDHTKDLQS